MAKAKEKESLYPKKVRSGYSLMRIASVIMIITGIGFFGLSALMIVVWLVPDANTLSISLPEIIFLMIFLFAIGLFDMLAAIAGFSYANHKTALVQAVGLFAFVSLIVFLAETISGVVSIFRRPDNAVFSIVGLVIANLGTLLYFLGWNISKNYFED